MSKDDAFAPSDEIIELTDIVEQGTLPEAVDEKSDSAFEQELDALFGEADMDAGAATTQDVNPNEELAMPDMSDLDSLLGDMGAGDPDPLPTDDVVGDADDDLEVTDFESSPAVEGVDELLADFIQGTDADESADDGAASASEGAEMDDSEVDDLDALLAEMGNDADSANTSKPAPKPANKEPESIASEVAEATASAQVKQEQNMPSTPPDDLDALFAELEAGDTLPSPQRSTPAESSTVEAALEDISPEADDTLSELDALIDDIMSPADTAPVGVASASVAMAEAAPIEPAPADVATEEVATAESSELPGVQETVDTVDTVDTADTMDTVDVAELTIEAPSAPASPVEALEQEPAPSAVQPVAEAPAAPIAASTIAPSVGPATSPVSSPVDSSIDLEFLAKELASGPLLAAMQTLIAQEVDKKLASQASVQATEPVNPDELNALVQNLVNNELEVKMAELEASLEASLEAKLSAGMDKATAAAAARIIREEIAALAEAL